MLVTQGFGISGGASADGPFVATVQDDEFSVLVGGELSAIVQDGNLDSIVDDEFLITIDDENLAQTT